MNKAFLCSVFNPCIHHQDTQESQEREGTLGTGAQLALEGLGETWDPWVQSLTWGISKEAAGGQW